MKLLLLKLIALALLVSSLEGATDAVRVAEHGGGPHDMHHPHHGGTNANGDESGAGTDTHACHCTAHVPPLGFGLLITMLAVERERPELDAAPNTYLDGPPPLPPPIV